MDEPRRWHHRPHLDGLRAVAATLVVLFHAGSASWAGGFVGVDVFFVLSGFLITGVWLSGRRDPVGFYARRARRLLPAALVTLLGTAVAWRLFAGPLEARSLASELAGAALYVSNWVFAGQAQDYFQHDQPPSPVLHFWSLAVEEQFYLVWPWMLAAAVAAAGRRAGALVALAGTLGLVGAAWIAQVDPVLSHYGTHARAWQLLLGAGLAFAAPRVPRGVGGAWAIGGLSAIGLAASGLAPLDPWPRGVLAVFGTLMLLFGGERAPEARLLAPLRWGWMRRLGAASYAAYLVHWPLVLMLDQKGLLPASGAGRVGLVLVGSWGLALVLHAVVERPAMRVALDTPRRRWAALLGGLLASAGTAGAGAAVLTVGIPGTVDISAHFERAEAKRTLVHGADGGGPRVLVAGDSHAEHWWPALEAVGARHGWDVDLYWVPACGWAEQDDRRCREAPRENCASELRATLHEELAREPAALVVLGSYMDGTCPVSGVSPEDPAYAAAVEAAAGATVDRVRGAGATVLLLEPIPALAQAPLTCVDAALDASRCAQHPVVEPGPAAAEAGWRAVAGARDGVGTVDLDAVACPGGACPTVVDDRLTRRDVHHLQPSFVRSRAGAVEAALVAAGLDLESASVGPSPATP